MNDAEHKALLLLGLARRARKLEIGEEPCGIACRSGKPAYVCLPFTKDELGDGLGCNACALCVLTDAPFAKAFLEALPELAERHPDILQELSRQTERVSKRRQEEKAHRKNVRFGKK